MYIEKKEQYFIKSNCKLNEQLINFLPKTNYLLLFKKIAFYSVSCYKNKFILTEKQLYQKALSNQLLLFGLKTIDDNFKCGDNIIEKGSKIQYLAMVGDVNIFHYTTLQKINLVHEPLKMFIIKELFIEIFFDNKLCECKSRYLIYKTENNTFSETCENIICKNFNLDLSKIKINITNNVLVKFEDILKEVNIEIYCHKCSTCLICLRGGKKCKRHLICNHLKIKNKDNLLLRRTKKFNV